MRDVVFKSFTSHDHKNRQLCLKEFIEENGISARVKKDYGYTIKSIVPLAEIGDLKQWLIARCGSENPSGLKDLSVCREHNSKTGEEKFEYKLTGRLFVVDQHNLFEIEFMYYFSIDSKILLDIAS